MKQFLLIFAALAILAIGLVGGIYLTGGSAALEQAVVGNFPTNAVAPSAEAAQTPPAPAPAPQAETGKRKILYYRNPMGLPDVSYEPKQDSMGMDYIPVYENEAGDQDDVVKISLDKVQKLGVATEPASMRRLTRTIRATGTVQPDESRQTIVTARFDGWIQRLHVSKTGDSVKRGQAMLDLFSPALRLAQQEYILARRTD
ncbi:MAG: efflux RND transporter periplasmic adaptor subunit, partial [Dongiaceae bacterium]